MDTPPGAMDAFEAFKTLVHCPPPLRGQLHATRPGRIVSSLSWSSLSM